MQQDQLWTQKRAAGFSDAWDWNLISMQCSASRFDASVMQSSSKVHYQWGCNWFTFKYISCIVQGNDLRTLHCNSFNISRQRRFEVNLSDDARTSQSQPAVVSQGPIRPCYWGRHSCSSRGPVLAVPRDSQPHHLEPYSQQYTMAHHSCAQNLILKNRQVYEIAIRKSS